MFWIHNLISLFKMRHNIVKHLPIPKLPVSKKKHQNWRILENIKSSIIKFVPKHRWLFIYVCKHDSLRDVKIKYTQECYGKQKWKSKSMCKANKDEVKNLRVLEMNYNLWASIKLNKRLMSNFFCLWNLFHTREATITKSAKPFCQYYYCRLNIGHESLN